MRLVKYPRTPHLSTSYGTPDDKRLGLFQSEEILEDPSLIVEEKVDGTQIGISFNDGKLLLQSRGNYINDDPHPAFDLLKQWSAFMRPRLEDCLGETYILFGEWLYAKHTIRYRKLPHYFLEFDLYDKENECFLDYKTRCEFNELMGLHTVPILHRGPCPQEQLAKLVGPSRYDSEFIHGTTGLPDNTVEGLYVRTERIGRVVARAKYVRPDFVYTLITESHWRDRPIVPNLLSDDANMWG